MVIYLKVYHQNLENTMYSIHIAVWQLNLMNSSFSVLPLIHLNELTNRDVFLRKDMIGGKTDNGKGDTDF